MTLAFDRDGQLLAGTESPGRVFRLDASGKPFVLLDAMLRVSQARTLAKVSRDASDKVAGFKPGAFKDPSEERGGCRLAVSARDHQIMAAAQEELFEGLRKRKIVKLAVQHGFYRGISAHHGIADDNEVRPRYIARSKTLGDRDALAR